MTCPKLLGTLCRLGLTQAIRPFGNQMISLLARWSQALKRPVTHVTLLLLIDGRRVRESEV